MQTNFCCVKNGNGGKLKNFTYIAQRFQLSGFHRPQKSQV